MFHSEHVIVTKYSAMQCDRTIVQQLWLALVLLSLHQMTPLHLAVESTRFKMVKCLLDREAADINLQDDNEVILYTDAVDYFELSGRCCIHCPFSFCFLNIRLFFKLQKLSYDL